MKRYFPNVKHPRLILSSAVCCALIAVAAISANNVSRRAGDRLITAIEAGNLDAVRLELNGWANVNETREMIDPPINGRPFRETWHNVSPLYRAAGSENLHIARALIDAGAELETVVEPAGWTALHRAAMFSNDDMVLLLIDAGAEVTATDHLGRTPLECAESRRRQFARDAWNRLGRCVLRDMRDQAVASEETD